jgi:hypothetical protein
MNVKVIGEGKIARNTFKKYMHSAGVDVSTPIFKINYITNFMLKYQFQEVHTFISMSHNCEYLKDRRSICLLFTPKL